MFMIEVNRILATVNYKTCMPIRMKFAQVTTGNTINYKDATNDFNYEVCTPKAIAEANKNYSISINSLISNWYRYSIVWMDVG
ncbi:MAG: hypothetical protein V9E96_05000 [Chitinophagaceae bacterium]